MGMSYNVQILGEDEIITEDLFIRPLTFSSTGLSDTHFTTNCFSDSPINNYKWTKVLRCLGKYWLGKTVGEYNEGTSIPYEFVRGELPASHIF